MDYEYALKFAELSKAGGATFFGLVSSQGANANSYFLYPRTKGEIENAVTKLGFDRTYISRPGLIGRGDKSRGVEKFIEGFFSFFFFSFFFVFILFLVLNVPV